MFHAVKEGWFRGVFTSPKTALIAICGHPSAKYQQFFDRMVAYQYTYGHVGGVDESTRASPVVFTDGSFRYKTKRAGYGVYFGENDTRNTSGYLPTVRCSLNAEGAAAMVALMKSTGDLEIRTDCIHLILRVTIRRPGSPLFRRIRKLAQNRAITWTYVPAHRGVIGNEAADALARWGSTSPCEKSNWWRRPNKMVDTRYSDPNGTIALSDDWKTYLEALLYGSIGYAIHSQSLYSRAHKGMRCAQVAPTRENEQLCRAT